MKRVLIRGAAALLLVAVIPVAAFAQASITGVVKDTSGAVLPGVTVEASSPVLIEKTRTTVTDGSGQYQIINLLPGTYTVTFTLPGFNVFKRDGIELSGSFVATVNADMRVGALAETITVTGQTPLVDVRSSAVQKVVTKEVVDAIPTGRLGINLAALQPGIILGAGGGVGQANTNALTSQDVGGTAGDTFTDLAIHGGKPAEQRQTIGGLSAATTIRFGESLSSSPSFTAMQEMSVNTSGADASLTGGGVQINYVPRDGGNTFKGLLFYSFANGGMQGSNFSTIQDDPVTSLEARGLRVQPGALKKRVRLQSRVRRTDRARPALVVRDGAMDESRKLRLEQLPEPELRPWPDEPDPSQHDDHDLPASDERGTPNYDGRRRRLLGADVAAHVADIREAQARHLLQQQEADVSQLDRDHVAGSAELNLLLPVL